MARVSVQSHLRRRRKPAIIRPAAPRDEYRNGEWVPSHDKWNYYLESQDEVPNLIKVSKSQSGAISLSGQGDDEFIYLYPDQAAALKKLLEKK